MKSFLPIIAAALALLIPAGAGRPPRRRRALLSRQDHRALQSRLRAGGQYVIARGRLRAIWASTSRPAHDGSAERRKSGGLKLLNQLYAVGARDGTVIGAGISGTATGALLTPGVAKFDPRQFAWIGSAGTETFIVVITDKSRVQTLDELYTNELIIGGSASGSASVDFPLVTNAILGTKFKIITGYPAAGPIVKIAMPAGEVEELLGLHPVGGQSQQRARLEGRQDQDLLRSGAPR